MRPGACGRKCPHVPSALGVGFSLLPFPDLFRPLPLRAPRTRRSAHLGLSVDLAGVRLWDYVGTGTRAPAPSMPVASSVGACLAMRDLEPDGMHHPSSTRPTTTTSTTTSSPPTLLAGAAANGTSSMVTEKVAMDRIGAVGTLPSCWIAPC